MAFIFRLILFSSVSIIYMVNYFVIFLKSWRDYDETQVLKFNFNTFDIHFS